ncbi:unnamed protein product, partial [marine sediment metagenome]
AIRRGVAYLVGGPVGGRRGVYQTSLKVMALQSVDPVAYQRQIAEGARYLMRVQEGSGGWSYSGPGTTDNSNSQFAVLGLNAAALSGVAVPDAVWQKARNYYRVGQNRDGGWGYRPGSTNSYGSMTAAGVASLYICDMWLHISSGECGVYADDRAVQVGLGWLARNFSVATNPRHRSWKFYYLYALERAGVILARRYFGRIDWYRQGVEHLAGQPPGALFTHSGSEWPFLKKCFALLFLAKGNAPILIHKAQWSGKWDTYRYDARFLVEYVGRRLDQPLDWQILPLSAPLDLLMAAPILYINGTGGVGWTPDEIRRLKEY